MAMVLRVDLVKEGFPRVGRGPIASNNNWFYSESSNAGRVKPHAHRHCKLVYRKHTGLFHSSD